MLVVHNESLGAKKGTIEVHNVIFLLGNRICFEISSSDGRISFHANHLFGVQRDVAFNSKHPDLRFLQSKDSALQSSVRRWSE